MQSIKLLTALDYSVDLKLKISKAKKRIFISTYAIDHSDFTKDIFSELQNAVKRNIEVNILSDFLTFQELKGSFLGPIDLNHRSSEILRSKITELEKLGASITFLGQPKKIFTYLKTLHQKWSVVDNHVYCFGGVNLTQLSQKSADFMFHIVDKELADFLCSEQLKIIKTYPNYPGAFLRLTDDTELHIDSSHYNDSVIYTSVTQLAKKATKAIYVSQAQPVNELAKILKNTDSTYFFNHPSSGLNKQAKTILLIDKYIHRIKNSYTKSTYIHAKFLILTMPDGTKTAISGSHNLHKLGVRFGAVESSMVTTNDLIIKKLEQYYQRHIKA